MTAVEAEADEAARFGGMIDTTVSAYAREDDTPINETRIHIRSVTTERELVEREGFVYVRLAIQDHTWPTPEVIDAFILLVRDLDPDQIWLHLLARLNPLPFLRKYAPVMVQVFSMASSNASIPVNMEACEKKLGISSRVFSLSIPLGATLNMDGTCIHLAVFALALAKVYGVPVSGGALLPMIVSIILLSMGAPGIPGSGLICLSVLLTQMNVPVEAIGLVMGIDSLIGMFRCMSNCLGDVAVTSIVAKSEGQMDMEVYRQ